MDKPGDPIGDSNERLQANVDRSQPQIFASYGLVGAILAFGAIGYVLDRWTDVSPRYLIGGLLVGVVVGFYTVIASTRTARHDR